MEDIIKLINELNEIIVINNIQNQIIINEFKRVCKIFQNYHDEYDKHSKFQDYFKMNDLDYFIIKLQSIKDMV